MQVTISTISSELKQEMWQYLTHADNKEKWQMSMACHLLMSVIYFPNKEDALFFKLKFGL